MTAWRCTGDGYLIDQFLRDGSAFHLIALRRGEAAGLRWCDVDLDRKVAYISWQIQYAGSALVLCPLKTAASRRVLALDATTVQVLRRYREEQDHWYRGHGRILSGYVFTALDGGPMSPDYLTQAFTQLVQASGLPPVRLHDLRHGAASLTQMGRVASGASFGIFCEHAPPAAQRTALRRYHRDGAWRSTPGLGCH